MMKRKQTPALFAAILFLAALLCGCGGASTGGGTATVTEPTAAPVSDGNESSATEVAVTVPLSSEQFSDSDFKDVSEETPNATITLSGETASLSDSTRGSDGTTVTITSKGIYRVSGSSEGVQIVVDDSTKSGNIYLVLDNVSMTNSDACILVKNADKVILQLVGDSELNSSNPDTACVYAKDDLTINGGGSLTVSSGKHGIVCKNDLKLTQGTITVLAAGIGLKAMDSVRLGGASVGVVSGHDGVQIDSEDGSGWFYMDEGGLLISAGYDGIDVGSSAADSYPGYLMRAGGTVEITAGGGSDNAKGSNSQKALKCDGSIYVTAGTLTASGADDALHAGGDVAITGGAVSLSSSDDGIHAGGSLSISDGTITVSKSYEGLEAETVSISGGEVAVYASDDGVNAAGGSDSASTEVGPWAQGSGSGEIRISGGQLYVNAGGDGLDSNGSIYISGGYTIVEGPTAAGNGALDKGDGNGNVCSVTGGTLLALGTSDMAINFDAGTQCSALVSLSGKAGDEITVDDGSGFSFTASKAFSCLVYTNPKLQQGSSYTIHSGDSNATADFSTGLYYSDLPTMGGGPGGKGGLGR